MTDIHCHILYGLDDGARSWEMSCQMLDIAVAAGTRTLAATPHSDLRYRYDENLVEERLAELRTHAAGRIQLFRGCDFHLSFENMRDALRHPERYTLNGGRYLLVEFPEETISSNATALLSALLDAGMVPVITHPERNFLLRNRKAELEAWIKRGCLVQVTGQSLLGRFGRSARAFANELMAAGLVHFLASDGHDARRRPPELASAYARIAERWDEECATLLCERNPAAAVRDREVHPLAPRSALARTWFARLFE